MTTLQFETRSIVRNPRIALVLAQWHFDIVKQFRDAFLEEFKAFDGRDVDIYQVPGAFEIPLLAKQLCSSGDYAGVVACGLVVDGGIYRHEFVASAVIDGLMRAQMDTGVPVFSGVLTPKDFTSRGRADFFRDHFVVKGREVAHACAKSLGIYSELEATQKQQPQAKKKASL
ncbi:MAG: 6,7-dimethyl-8-ribityllumazine synthase [Pseudomonadota bacterium]